MMLTLGIDPLPSPRSRLLSFAASEIAARVHRYVGELLAGAVPKPLRLALPGGLDPGQRERLAAAAAALDASLPRLFTDFART